MRIFVSPCLLNLQCRYDAEKKEIPQILTDLLKENCDVEIMGICPEFSFFHKTPRDKIMLENSSTIVFEDGTPLGEDFAKALNSLLISVVKFNPDVVILKEKSPSCGLHKVFIRNSGWNEGFGVWASLLKKNLKTKFYNEDGVCG